MKKQMKYIIIAVIIFILGGINFYRNVINILEQNTSTYVQEIALQHIKVVKARIDSEMNSLKIISDRLYYEIDPFENGVNQFLDGVIIQKYTNLEDVILYNEEGIPFNTSGIENIDATKNNNFQTALEGKISKQYNKEDDKHTYEIYLPVKSQNKIIGVLYAYYSRDGLDKLLSDKLFDSSYIENEGYVFVLDKNGEEVSALDVKIDTEKLISLDESIKNKMKGEESGHIIHEYNNKKYVTYYTPIGEEWYLFTMAPNFAVADLDNKFVQSIIIYIGICVAGVILILGATIKPRLDLYKKDPLTNLLSKKHFENKVREALKKGSGIIIVMDLDNFKGINDIYGHNEGDLLIIKTAEIIKHNFRSTDLIGRFGGDEFVIFITEQISEEQLKNRLDKINSDIKEHAKKYEKTNISSSAGAVYARQNDNYTDIFEKADKQLYNAKEQGKGRNIIEKNNLP